MKKEVKEQVVRMLKDMIEGETLEIDRNRREINKLADKNTALKRLRAKHIQVLRDFTMM